MRLRVISTRPELGDVEHLGAGLVPGQGVAEGLDDLVAVAFDLHVDEVDDDDAADVAQAELPGDLARRPRGCCGRPSPRGSTSPTFLPVLTSMTVSASVCSMMSEPPEGSHTLRSRALWSCSCTWWRSKIESGSTVRS